MSRILVATGEDWCIWGPNLAERENCHRELVCIVFLQFPLPEGLCVGNTLLLWVKGRHRAAWGMAFVLNTSLLLGKNC